MQLTNDFEVALPPEELWDLLTDIERIAPALPGFKFTGQEEDTYTGTMTIKVGAVTVTYNARLRFIEKDESSRRAVIEAEGRETRGQGSASATITSTVEETGAGSKATMVTDFTVTGRVAQFGRGVIGDVSERLVKQFVKTLERQTAASPQDAPTSAANSAPGSPERTPEGERNEPLNLMSVAATPLLKRAAPLILLGIVIAIFLARR
jgi:carbon monoxide dehydrogenase subunit G